jgi:GxxExxY protein
MIVTSAMTVHSRVGPGLLERAYEAFLARELENRGLSVRRQVHLPLEYEGEHVEMAYRLDLLVEEQVIVEVKAVSTILPIHKAQLLSYLRLTGLRVGLLLNFHEVRLKHGITRMRD